MKGVDTAPLKPCPFCGCKVPGVRVYPATFGSTAAYGVFCPVCAAQTRRDKDRAQARQIWNDRKP